MLFGIRLIVHPFLVALFQKKQNKSRIFVHKKHELFFFVPYNMEQHMKTTEYFRKALWHYLDNQPRGAQTKLAEGSGINRIHLNDFLAGRREMKEALRSKITDHLKCDYLSFLLQGKMLLEGKSPDSFLQSDRPLIIRTHKEAEKDFIDTEHYSAIPLYESGRIAAFSNGAAYDRYEVPTSEVLIYMPELGIRAKHRMIAAKVGGDSMEPLIPEKSIVIIDLDDKEFSDNKVYAIALNDGIDMSFAVKRVRKFEQAEGFLLLSENIEYQPRIVVESDWLRLCVGRVIWMWRSLE